MKNLLLYLMLFISFPIFGQETKIDSSDLFPDFTKVNVDVNQQGNSPIRINKIDTILELFGENNWDTDFEIVSNNKIISKRRYFPDTKIINKEFIRVNKLTYHYLENDSLNNNRLIAEGDFIVSINPFMSIDTIQTIYPTTSETIGQIIKRPKLLKEGEWFESDSVFIYRGNYKNGKREGKWFKSKRMWTEYDQRDLAYENGNLISEIQLNLVKKGDINAIKEGLIGTWWLEHNPNRTDNVYIFSRNRENSYTLFKFNTDSTFRLQLLTCGYNKPQEKNQDIWRIKGKFEIEIDKSIRKEHYQLLSLSKDMLILRIIEN